MISSVHEQYSTALDCTLCTGDCTAAARGYILLPTNHPMCKCCYMRCLSALSPRNFSYICAALQKLEADIARWQEEIPADQATAEQLGTQLEDAEQKLEQLQDGIKGEVEGYHQQLTKVRAALSSVASMCEYALIHRHNRHY